MITDVKGGVTAFEWSPDGKSLALVMRDAKSEDEEKADKEKRDWRTIDENVKMSRLYVAPVDKGADGKRTPRLLTTGAYSVGDFDWSPDGRPSSSSTRRRRRERLADGRHLGRHGGGRHGAPAGRQRRAPKRSPSIHPTAGGLRSSATR